MTADRALFGKRLGLVLVRGASRVLLHHHGQPLRTC